MSQVIDELLYAESHEWLKLLGDGTGLVGITDHAQIELTDVVYVELPKVGTATEAGSQIAVVESVKAASDIYAPISGEILEGNAKLDSDPSLINTDPYGDGWIFKIKLAEGASTAHLKSAADYKTQIGE